MRLETKQFKLHVSIADVLTMIKFIVSLFVNLRYPPNVPASNRGVLNILCLI